jgi:hypothetical protein
MYKYEFAGWDKTVAETCVGNATYVANFTSSFVEYAITFRDYNGAIISEKADYHYGDVIQVPATPIRKSDSSYEYTFEKWNGFNSNTVTSSGDYVAVYTKTPINAPTNNGGGCVVPSCNGGSQNGLTGLMAAVATALFGFIKLIFKF